MRLSLFLFFIGYALVSAPTARAVPPPDFIFTITSQAGPAFAFIVVALSMAAAGLRQLLAPSFSFIRKKKWIAIPAFVVILGLGIVGAFKFDAWRQDRAYKAWLAGSSAHTDPDAPAVTASGVDLLAPEDMPVAGEPASEDAGARFIRSYYADIGAGRIAQAYAVSKKTVPLETFRSWYAHTTGVKVDSLQPVGDGRYSLALTLAETGETTRYAVLMTLAGDAPSGYRVADSSVRVITASGGEAGAPEGGAIASGTPASTPLAASNEEFAAARGRDDAFALDAREDEENAYGRLPGSVHHRFADLVAGDWILLPTDRAVYVICWSGIRGKEVAEFLRGKGIAARYLEKGASGWVAGGGAWDGKISFLDVYTDERYRIVLTKQKVEEAVAAGAVLVDSRPTAAFAAGHVPGSYSLPVIYTPTAKMPEALGAIPKGAPVVTVCDDFVSCFDAKIGGVKLEKDGHVFLGRFASPWEFN